jgi:hypothetical protein
LRLAADDRSERGHGDVRRSRHLALQRAPNGLDVVRRRTRGAYGETWIAGELSDDKVTTNKDTDARYHIFISGLTFDLNKRAGLSFDYQEELSDNFPVVNGATIIPTPPLKTLFVHLVANF